MLQYEHKETRKPAVIVSCTKFVPDAIEIKTEEDLPPIEFWEQLWIAPEILSQGSRALHYFFTAFEFIGKKVYYINVLPSGFPDGKVTLL